MISEKVLELSFFSSLTFNLAALTDSMTGSLTPSFSIKSERIDSDDTGSFDRKVSGK